MAKGDVYVVRHEATISTAITPVQIKAGANHGFEILAFSVTQRGSTTSIQEKIAWVRKTAGATVTTGAMGTHVFKFPNAGNPDLALGTTSTGVIATSEGTDGDVFWEEGFNVLSGIQKVLTLEERRIFSTPVNGILALKFRTAPASQLWNFYVSLMET